jgi:uncharacterized SAM-binding protein YcdF (DUF218 family)
LKGCHVVTPTLFSQADAIVVLGAAVWPGGVPSPALRRRLLHAVSLWRQGRADRLVLSGGIGTHPPAEADVMYRLARAEGVPAACLIREPTATSTWHNATACAALLNPQGWGRVIVVSDRYHLRRALLAFRYCGLEAVGSAADAGCSKPDWYTRLREVIALPWYVIRLRGLGGRPHRVHGARR